MSAAKGSGAAKKGAKKAPAGKGASPKRTVPAKKALAKKAPAKKALAKKKAPAKKAPAKKALAKKVPASAKKQEPAKQASRSPKAPAPNGAEGGRPVVLLVDDFPDAREMYLEYLDFSGFSSAEASNGLEAIEQALALEPAVILMDLAMPVMDGWEATRRLKADPRTRSIPVIAVTGHALEGDAERARQAGCDGVLSKPCLPENLVAEVRRLLAGGRT